MAIDPLERVRAALADRYDVERMIGEGGMALVFRAQDPKHGRTVAIKVLKPELSAAMGPDRFLREIHVAAQLQHPAILPVYDSGAAEGVLYYVMPFVEGESLRARLDREHQLPIPEAVALIREVADGLHFAHQRGVVHRDIKPENILLVHGHAALADFGIARAVGDGEHLTQTGMTVGTPSYMSPEQAMGSSEADARADQYSLACVLYELIIGEPPFNGPSAMAIIARHATQPVPSLRAVRQSVPDQLEGVIFQALEKTPADRFASMREFADQLGALDLGPTARRTPTGGIPTRTTGSAVPARPGARKRWLWPAVAGIVVLGGVGAWFGLHRKGGAPAANGPDPRNVAVLYFDTEGQNHDSLAYLADGLTEALIHQLSDVKPLHVISRNGVLPFRGKHPPLDSVARALGVGTVVDGVVRGTSNDFQVRVTLVNPVTGKVLGDNTVSGRRGDVLTVQDSIANLAAVFLRRELGGEVQLQQSRSGTRSAQAWELYQRAREQADLANPYVAANDTAAASRQFALADSLFGLAERQDSHWPDPATQRGWLAFRRARIAGGSDQAGLARWVQVGVQDADRALAASPRDPDALELRGTLRYFGWLFGAQPDPDSASRLHTAAEADLRAAIAANPGQAGAWNTLSHLLANESKPAEAKIAALQAYQLDPFLTNVNLTIWRIFQNSLDLNQQLDAQHWCAEGGNRFPNDYRFVECQLWLDALPGAKPDIPEAWRLLDRYVALSPAPLRDFLQPRGGMLVAIALARAGLKDSALHVASRSRAAANADPTRELAFLDAIVQTMVGDRTGALESLATYIAANPSQREALANDRTWWFETLRADPRYAQLVGPARS